MNNRILSMDFLRAAAILLVVLGHTVLSYGSPKALAPLQFGGTGVDLFFVLSGWLLGCQLFKELTIKNKVNIKKFWIRRWMRTLPAYYSVLLLSIIQQYLTKDDVSFPWEYFIFVQNYFDLTFFTISWSLSVEEQFYLAIAPLVAFFIKLKPEHRTLTLLILLCLPFFFRIMGLYEYTSETHVRWDGCIMGVLLANIRYSYSRLWKWMLKQAPYFALIALVIYLYSFYAHWNHALPFRNPDKLLLAFMFGSWVLLANSTTRLANKMYFPGANYIATRSYAMYLLHPEALAITKRFALELPFVIYLSIAFIFTMLLSELLYRTIELPSMNIRESFKVSSKDN